LIQNFVEVATVVQILQVDVRTTSSPDVDKPTGLVLFKYLIVAAFGRQTVFSQEVSSDSILKADQADVPIDDSNIEGELSLLLG